jgi:hypothetical protein
VKNFWKPFYVMAFLHQSSAEEGYQLLCLQYPCRSCISLFSCDIAWSSARYTAHQFTYCFHCKFNALVAQSSPHWTVAIRALAFVAVDIFDKLFYFGVLILLSDSFKVVVISLTIEIKSFKQLF